MKIRTIFLSTALAFAVASPAHAAGKTPATTVSAAPATPAQRGNAIRQFVRKWGAYVQTVYAVDVQDWAMRLVPQFANGDSTNIGEALQRQTFEGAMAALNGTGNLLASVSLTPNAGSCPGYSAGFCPYGPAGIGFNGVAKSVSFGGVANQIVFDDITFGSVTPNVPEPETYALMALGLGMVALASRRRRQQAA